MKTRSASLASEADRRKNTPFRVPTLPRPRKFNTPDATEARKMIEDHRQRIQKSADSGELLQEDAKVDAGKT
jgi:hypothetical protein